jgi:hypothetical protein
MRKSNWTPSIVPGGDDQNVYLVLDDFGRSGSARREADAEGTDLEAVILDLLEGQYKKPVRVIGFKPPKAGRRTFRPISRRKFASGATFSFATFPFSGFRGSVRRAVSRYPASLADAAGLNMGRPRAKPPAIGAKAPFPGFVEPALASFIHKVPSGERGSTRSSSTATACRSIW